MAIKKTSVCSSKIEKINISTYVCPNCKLEEQSYNEDTEIECPQCQSKMVKVEKQS